MAWSKSHLDKLDEQIAKGVFSVEFEGKKLTFRSQDEMLQLRRLIRDELKAQSGQKRPRTYINPVYKSGLD